jgi:uncharacterized membrane protein YgdD (TMEM256/DUF423 family)
MLESWEVGVRYQMYTALGLVLLGLWGRTSAQPIATSLAGVMFLLGILVFSGGLYLLVLTGERTIGAIVPLGGVAMIVGWLILAVHASRANDAVGGQESR